MTEEYNSDNYKHLLPGAQISRGLISICKRCGVQVFDENQHDRFHKAIVDVISKIGNYVNGQAEINRAVMNAVSSMVEEPHE